VFKEDKMTHISRDLHNAFPDDSETLRALKATDTHFQALVARFEALDDEAHQIEAGTNAASDERLEVIKKHRLAILDEIAAIVAAKTA